MLHKEFWGLLFLGFIAWVFIAGTPQERINHFCRPIGWAGNAVVSLSALAVPNQQENVQGWFDKFEYGCQYMTWRLFYQAEYNAWKAQQEQGATSAVGTSKPQGAAKPASASSTAR